MGTMTGLAIGLIGLAQAIATGTASHPPSHGQLPADIFQADLTTTAAVMQYISNPHSTTTRTVTAMTTSALTPATSSQNYVTATTAAMTTHTPMPYPTDFLGEPKPFWIQLSLSPHEAAMMASYMHNQLENPDAGFCTNVDECFYNPLSSESINSLLNRSTLHFNGDPDQATRFAMYARQHHHMMTTMTTFLPPTTSTDTVEHILGLTQDPLVTGTSITSLPTTIGNTVWVSNTTGHYDYVSAAAQTPIPTPPSCLKGTEFNMTRCRYQTCMMKHHQPIVITTVFMVAEYAPPCYSPDVSYPWITRTTQLASAHWGITSQGGLYYPYAPTVTSKKYRTDPFVTMTSTRPANTDLHGAAPPSCWDVDSCCAECRTHANAVHGYTPHLFMTHSAIGRLMLAGIIIGSLIGLLLVIWSAVKIWDWLFEDIRVRDFPWSKRRPISEKTVVVSTSPAGTVVTAPSTSSVVTAAQVTDDGKGTQGRRAEEGRGRVQFAPDTAAPAATEQVVVTTPAPAPAQEQVVVTETPAPGPAPTTTVVESAAPVAVHDGTGDYQTAGMGSVRGRSRRH